MNGSNKKLTGEDCPKQLKDAVAVIENIGLSLYGNGGMIYFVHHRNGNRLAALYGRGAVHNFAAGVEAGLQFGLKQNKQLTPSAAA